MKLKLILPAALIALAGCSQNMHTLSSGHTSKKQSDSLFVTLAIKDVIKTGEKVNLKFVVHNNQSMGKSFCKWYTPFEPLMSNYLDIKDENGNEAIYKGPMAKRIMPPPADSYLVVNPKDTILADVNLLKGYQLQAGKKYTISYNSGGMSGLRAANKATFTYAP